MRLLASSFFVFALFLVTSCKSARFGFLSKDTPKGAQESPAPSGGNVVSQRKPTGTLEALQSGVVTEILVLNKDSFFQPTAATFDPDYQDKEECINPGILKADYSIEGKTYSVSRSEKGCESFAVKHIFASTGVKKISALYTSRDNETSTASITIKVVEENAPPTQKSPALSLEATPQVATPGQKFSFKARCQVRGDHILAWDFGDGTAISKDNPVTSDSIHEHWREYVYQSDGQITVTVTTDSDGQPLEASTTILVTRAGNTTPQPSGSSGPSTSPSSSPSSGPSTTPTPTGPGQNNPGQNPGQNGPGQSKP